MEVAAIVGKADADAGSPWVSPHVKTIGIKLEHKVTAHEVRSAIRDSSRSLGLTATLSGTLKAHPGSLHWHFRSGSGAGTLEATFWPSENRLWLSVQSRRDAAWVNRALRNMKRALDGMLARRVSA